MTEDIMRLADQYASDRFLDGIFEETGEDAIKSRAALRAAVKRLERENEVLRHERNAARNQVDIGVKLLTGIHSLLYPPLTKLPDGRVMAFRPKDPDPHTVLQELSDRIRALPEEVNRLEREAAMQRVSAFAQECEEIDRLRAVLKQAKAAMCDFDYDGRIAAIAAIDAELKGGV